MNDMRRTILWVVFMMSLFLLWEGWQKHNGRPSMLEPAKRPVAAASAPAGSTGTSSGKAS